MLSVPTLFDFKESLSKQDNIDLNKGILGTAYLKQMLLFRNSDSEKFANKNLVMNGKYLYVYDEDDANIEYESYYDLERNIVKYFVDEQKNLHILKFSQLLQRKASLDSNNPDEADDANKIEHETISIGFTDKETAKNW